jgi:threonine aldolase
MDLMKDSLIDLRSDTVTLPTEAMRDAMHDAEVGDAMRGDDPTLNRLEALAAEKIRKEAAIFVPSGTMGNLVCLLSHTHPGDEVIFEADAHVYYYEAGGFAAVAGLAARPVQGHYGVMAPEDIEAAIRPTGPYFPTPRLLCIENTHNRGFGNAIRPEDIEAMASIARAHGLAVHLDGARIFNAAIALGVDVGELTRHVDSVQYCLSKGLSAPVGSMVAGSLAFIERARKMRKLVGGDLRQSGVLAAAGIVALNDMIDRLVEDHHHAALLADGLRGVPGLTVQLPPIPTNMVFSDTTELRMTAAEFLESMREHGVLCTSQGPHRVRMVTHRHITPVEIERAVAAAEKVTLHGHS